MKKWIGQGLKKEGKKAARGTQWGEDQAVYDFKEVVGTWGKKYNMSEKKTPNRDAVKKKGGKQKKTTGL